MPSFPSSTPRNKQSTPEQGRPFLFFLVSLFTSSGRECFNFSCPGVLVLGVVGHVFQSVHVLVSGVFFPGLLCCSPGGACGRGGKKSDLGGGGVLDEEKGGGLHRGGGGYKPHPHLQLHPHLQFPPKKTSPTALQPQNGPLFGIFFSTQIPSGDQKMKKKGVGFLKKIELSWFRV